MKKNANFNDTGGKKNSPRRFMVSVYEMWVSRLLYTQTSQQ